MRRTAGLIVILALVAGGLWATGVVTVTINPPSTDSVSASPFWQEVKSGEAQLPPPLRIWVDLAKATRPAVVNVSTTQRAKARGPLSEHRLARRLHRHQRPRRGRRRRDHRAPG